MDNNIYIKLQSMRVELQEMNIKKSGINKFAGYTYYELSDILPPINQLQAKHKTCSIINFNNEFATLKLVNSELPSDQIDFTSPMSELSLKGGQAIQNLGGIETYQRRYLYMTAFEIVENDFFDSIQGTKKEDHSGLPEEIGEKLNIMIRSYSSSSGKTISEISKELFKIVGKDLKSISKEEGNLLLRFLEEKNAKLKQIKQG